MGRDIPNFVYRMEIGRYVSVTVSGRMFPVERGLPAAVL